MDNEENIMVKKEPLVKEKESKSIDERLASLEKNVDSLMNLLLKKASSSDKLRDVITLKSFESIKRNDSSKESKFDRQLYLAKLSPSTTTEEIRNYFTKYGTVVDAFILPSKNGFVEFLNKFMKEKALDDRPHFINEKCIYVDKARGPRTQNLSGGGFGRSSKTASPSSSRTNRFSPY